MVPRSVRLYVPPESDKYWRFHGLNVSTRSPETEPKNIRLNLEPSKHMDDLTHGELL